MKGTFADIPDSKKVQSTARIKSGGFTLVEVLMCIAILSVLIRVVLGTFLESGMSAKVSFIFHFL